MPEATLPYPQGAPCWVDIAADPQPAVIDFYRTVLGWTDEPSNPEFGNYVMMSVGGRPAAGIMPVTPDQSAGPSSWTVYFAVTDIAASAEKVAAHGGTVFIDPREVPTVGHWAMAQDPDGAVFGLWQPAPFDGIAVIGEPGAPYWFQLDSTRGGPTAEFYAAVFGTEAAELKEMPGQYWLLKAAGREVAGVWKAPGDQAGHTARWHPYFQVEDTDAAIERATSAGASVLQAAQDSPYGRLALLTDPFGAQFAVATAPKA